MQVYLFKLLRYLFSYEKHKKVVKDLFPPNLFSLFVDVGNFNKNLAKY